jgi:molybdopterin-guanine dinucleotide biosynthesis protein A
MFPLSVVILAGGQSRRMGTDKAFLTIEGRPLIQRMMERVRDLADEVVIVANDPEPYRRFGVRIVGDLMKGAGALGGLQAGLSAAMHEWAFAFACDMPFLNPALLRHMVSLAPGYEAVVPRLGGTAEPLHALYHKRCLAPIARSLAERRLQMISFLAEVRVRYIEEVEIAPFDPQRLSFFNANTPEEWQEALRLLGTSVEGPSRDSGRPVL